MKDNEFVEKSEEFMIDCFESSNLPKVIAEGMIRHLLQTREYLLELTEGTSRDTTPLEIAALLHGIERAFRKGEGYRNLIGKKHEDRSAAIAKDFLEKKKAPKSLIKKTVSLIEKHETAPTKESKLLREADNLSFLENTLPIWFEARLWMGENKEEIIESCKKIVNSKYRQIKSKKGREIGTRFYRKWMHWLEQKKENL